MTMRIDNNRNLQTSSYWSCLRVTLLIFAIQLFAVTHLMAADRIVIPSLKIQPGTTQRLAIQLENEVAYTAFQVEIYFPEGITPVITNDKKYSVELSNRKANHTVSTNLVSDGGLKVLSYSFGNQSFTGNSGDLFYIDFVSDPTFTNSAMIEVKEVLFTRSSDRQELTFDDVSLFVSTRETVKGDVNGDGAVNIADAVCIVNHVVGKSTQAYNEAAADMNGDGVVDIADAVRIVNLVAGKISSF